MAASGGDANRLYPWGAATPTDTYAVVNCCFGDSCGSCTSDDRAPVGSKPLGRGRFGQDDLGGGVWEWVLDGFDANWYGGAGANCVDCANSSSESGRVVRGGSWYAGSGPWARAAARPGGVDAHTRNHERGLRCARDAAP
jgi:formylglycine-generating enzyme required for sulfatase activity